MLIEFFGNIKQSGELSTLEEKYIGHIEAFDYVDTRAFIRALDDKLPKWAPLFQKYSVLTFVKVKSEHSVIKA